MKTSPVTTACCAIAPGHIYTELADPATVSIKIQSYQLITVLAEHNNLTMNTSTHTPYTWNLHDKKLTETDILKFNLSGAPVTLKLGKYFQKLA